MANLGDAHGRASTTKGRARMKFRVIRLAATVAMLAALLEALGAGFKW
jgi:hypothetical protein